MKAVGRPRKYSRAALEAAVQTYFDSITRVVDITEKVDSGKRDSYNHVIWETVPVKNNLGEIAKRVEFLVPPTIEGLCLHLGIHSSTWTRWRDPAKYKSFKKIIEYVDDRMIAWRKEQVLIRKDVKGLIWDLEVNHGCGQKDKHTDNKPDMLVEGLPEEFKA